MAYEKPRVTLNQIDKAGKFLASSNSIHLDDLVEYQKALNLLWDWRSSHGYPLNALHMTLHNRSREIDRKSISAQRLKRYDSILRKLKRKSTMQLSQMQDIGGCRSILQNIKKLDALTNLYAVRPLRHECHKYIDYVKNPKSDGYRSAHFMYRFHGKGVSLPWDKLRIEIQMRTSLQHSWSTAVETVDAFTGQDMKFGGGLQNWRRFLH